MFYNNICFGSVVSFTRPKLMFDRKKTDNTYFGGLFIFCVYLLLIPINDASK